MASRNPDVVIKVNPPAKPKLSLQQKIEAAANEWAESIVDEDNLYNFQKELQEALNTKIYESLGIRIRRDMWDRGTKIEIDTYNNDKPLARLIAQEVGTQVAKLTDSVVFEPVELTQNEWNAIQRAYRTRFKEAAINAAREVAEKRAYEYAERVLEIEVE